MMENTETSLSIRIQRPKLDQIRRHLLNALDQALNDWSLIVSLKHGELTNDRGRVILCFMEQIVHSIALAIDLKKDEIEHTYWKWKAEDEFAETISLIELNVRDNEFYEGEERKFSSDSVEYAALKSGSYIVQDRYLVLRAWVPALDKNAEMVLLFRLTVPNNRILTNEVVSIIETNYEILLTGIRSADYLSIKKIFFSSIQYRIPDKKLAETSESLLYLEAWRSSWEVSRARKQRNTIGLDRWLNPDAEPVEMDSPEQDYVLASHLASLMYLTNQGHVWARERLQDALQRTTGDDILIKISRGPTISARAAMKRTHCIVAQARTLLSPQGLPNEEREKLRQGLESGLSDPQKVGYMKASWSVIELEAGNLTQRTFPPNESLEKLEGVVKEAQDLTVKMVPLLDKALRNSGKCIELSSRWLDAWFGLRLLASEVLPQEHLENFEPLRAAELVKSWACYFRYLLDYFVIRQLRADKGTLPDLPTEPASDAVEQAQLTLICEWAHGQEVPRTIPLQAWLSKTYETELALYSLSGKGSYRQHIFHVQDTCLLGCAMLFSCWREGDNTKTYWELLAGASGQTRADLLCNWLVASLLHDIGYGLQVVPLGLEALPEGITKGLDDLVKDIKHRMKQAPPGATDYDPTSTRTGGKLEISDHAQVSMTAVLAQLRSLSDQWQMASAFNPAMAAIIDHGSKDSPIDYISDPLSALIVICDQLQDWGRIRLDTSLLASSFLANMRMAPDEEPDPMIIKKLFYPSRLYVSVDNLDEECNFVNPVRYGKRVMEFLVHGPHAGEAGYEPAAAWLDVCRAFQRIRQSKSASKNKVLPEIHVTLQHGVAKNESPELHRLDRFAHDNEEQRGVILDWLTQVRKQKIIRYGCSREPHRTMPSARIPKDMKYECYEWIEYSIPSLNNNEDRPLKGLPDKLYKAYREFRKRETARKA